MMLPRAFHVTTFIASSESLREAMSSCVHGLSVLGFEVSQGQATIRADAINVVLTAGGDLQLRRQLAQVEHVIVYNWEQILPTVPWVNWQYFKMMTRVHVWDYSRSNVAMLKKYGVQDVHHLPMVYSPQMSVITSAVEPDIDVLFYGNLNERRQKVIDAIRALGLHVVTSADVGHMIGATRDAYIARARVVLNMHGQDESTAFEMARVSYLLANRKAVVSEVNENNDVDDDIRAVIACGSLEQLPHLCAELVADDARRNALEQSAFDAFTRRDSVAIMNTAVQRYFAAYASSALGNQPNAMCDLPRVLHIGTVQQADWRFNQLNVDACSEYAPDIVLDISEDLPSQAMHSWRFGAVVVQHGYFERIIARNVFQRVENFERALTNCLHLLQDGGILELSVPLDLSYEAWAHIDDRRAFNDKTWARIIDAWWQYDGWDAYRFEIVSTGYGVHAEYGVRYLNEHNSDWAGALLEPRVIDAIHVTLRKRSLTNDEKNQLPQQLFME